MSEERVDHLVVGGFALAGHGLPRTTRDIDIWIRATRENAARVYRALAKFGAPLTDLKPDDLSREGAGFQIGVAPQRIDILTQIEGVSFEEAWPHRVIVEIEGLTVPVIGRVELIKNKRAAGRLQDLADVERLERQPRRQAPPRRADT